MLQSLVPLLPLPGSRRFFQPWIFSHIFLPIISLPITFPHSASKFINHTVLQVESSPSVSKLLETFFSTLLPASFAMNAVVAPSSSWLQDRGNHQERTVTMSDTQLKQRSSGKRGKVRFSHQFHMLTRALLPSPFGSRPMSQVRGSSQYRSPSPFPRDKLVDEVDTPEERPELPEGATQYDVQDEPSRPESRGSNPSSMWGPPVAFLNDARQSHSSSRPTSQGVQARREVKVIAPPTSEEQPQSAIIEKMRKSYPSLTSIGRIVP